MNDNITLQITEKRVSFDPVVDVKIIPANNNGRKIKSKPSVRSTNIENPVHQKPVLQTRLIKHRRFGMQFIN